MKIACQARTFILIFAKNSNSNSSNFAREDGEVGEWYWPSGIDWARVAVASCHLPFGSFVFCNFAIEMQHWFELQTRELLRCNSPDYLLLFYSSYWHVTIAPNQPITPPPFHHHPSLRMPCTIHDTIRADVAIKCQKGAIPVQDTEALASAMSLSSIVSMHTDLVFVQPDIYPCVFVNTLITVSLYYGGGDLIAWNQKRKFISLVYQYIYNMEYNNN